MRGMVFKRVSPDYDTTGETIRSLLEPLIGKSGSITLLVSNVGPISIATARPGS